MTMLEALIVVTLTALIAALVYPLTTASARHAAQRSAALAASVEWAAGERAFRQIASSARPDAALRGNPSQAAFAAIALQDGPCAPRGADASVSLRIERAGEAGALVCAGDGRAAHTLAQWPAGEAALSYARTSEPVWRANSAPANEAGGLIRFVLTPPDAPRVVWVAALGRVAPQSRDPSIAP